MSWSIADWLTLGVWVVNFFLIAVLASEHFLNQDIELIIQRYKKFSRKER